MPLTECTYKQSRYKQRKITGDNVKSRLYFRVPSLRLSLLNESFKSVEFFVGASFSSFDFRVNFS